MAQSVGWILSRVLKNTTAWDFATRDTATLLRAGVEVALFRYDYHATPAKTKRHGRKLHWGVNYLLELACSFFIRFDQQLGCG